MERNGSFPNRLLLYKLHTQRCSTQWTFIQWLEPRSRKRVSLALLTPLPFPPATILVSRATPQVSDYTDEF